MKESKMSAIDDPFEAPIKTVEESANTSENVRVPLISTEGEQVRITMKSGAGYEVPWITVDFPSIDVAHERLSDAERKSKLMDIFKITAGASAKFAEQVAELKPANVSSPTATSVGYNPRAPQGIAEAPGGEKRFCPHGEMQFKTGVSKAGKAYQLFSCTAPREQQCKAQFL